MSRCMSVAGIQGGVARQVGKKGNARYSHVDCKWKVRSSTSCFNTIPQSL